jgi:uncharacterized protein
MKLEQSFEVAAPPARVWEALIDVERVAPCLPGVSITGRSASGIFNGVFTVKIGPTAAAYAGTLSVENIDAEARVAKMQTAGTDKRGQGGAEALITSTVADGDGGGTTVTVESDYRITGRLARFGRGGAIEEICKRLLGEFAANLQELLDAEEPTDPVDPDAVIEGATPVTPPPVTPPPVTPPPAYATEPTSAPEPAGLSAWERATSNPAPLVALVVGFLVALRVFRRRG